MTAPELLEVVAYAALSVWAVAFVLWLLARVLE
jgi:hypothetical protein